MPKGTKVAREERERWLEMYERGNSFVDIGEDSGRDQSTVAKQVRVAQEERTRSIARTELIRSVLEQHNKKMFDALGRHRDRLHFRPAHQIATAHSHPYQTPLSKHDYGFVDDLKEFKVVPWHVEGENGLENELVREHLFSTKATMWRQYDRWLEDHARYLWHVWRLGHEAYQKFSTQTGLKPEENGEGFRQSCIIKMVEATLELAGQGSSETVTKLKINKNILETGLSILAYSESAETLKKARDAFKSIVKDLSETEDAKDAAKAIPGLNEQAAKIRRQFELIRVMGFIEGTCEACKSFVK